MLLLAVLAGLTVLQCRQWRSDVALWSVAVRANRTSPRPALNLAIGYRKAANTGRGSFWLVEAAWRAERLQQRARWYPALSAQVLAFEFQGQQVCDFPSLQPYC